MDNPSHDYHSREKPGIPSDDIVVSVPTKEDESAKIEPNRNISMDQPVDEKGTAKKLDLIYYVDDTPPWYLCILLGFQHYLTMFGATISLPLILAPALCMTNTVHISEFISTCFFVSGLITMIQVTVGIRLPIVQGGTFAFLTPAFAILSLPEWQCPKPVNSGGGMTENITSTMSTLTGDMFNLTENITSTMSTITGDMLNITENITSTMSTITGGYMTTETTPTVDDAEVWQIRLREIQGAIIMASLLQVVIGMSGLIGLLLRFIGPIVIAPTIALIGLSLFKAASGFCSANWPIAIMTIFFIVLFSQYLRNVNFPCCAFSKGNGCACRGYPIFKLFPIILGIMVSWAICGILTASNALPNDEAHWGYKARTDTKSEVLAEAKWFRFPYPGQWGTPTFSPASVFGMMSGVLAGMIESIGDYYACARLSGAPPPPVHAINRGILIEGLGCIIAGLWGTGTGTTSYSENIGAIGITKVSSRRVVLFGAGLMLILGMLGKFGALFVTIPDPIVGGVFMVMFGMISAVGISNLQFIDMNSSRNLFIFGFSLFFGLSLPDWMQTGNNADIIDTGNTSVDQIITVLLSTSMFVGGTVAFILDNTVPGTDEERGMVVWKKQLGNAETDGEVKEDMKIYNFPFGMSFINKWEWTKYVPICPTFGGFRFGQPSCKKNNKSKYDMNNGKGEETDVNTKQHNKDSNLHHRTSNSSVNAISSV